MDARLDFAHELERRDREVARKLERLARLDAEVDRIRSRAAALASFLARLPVEREQLHTVLGDANRDLERVRARRTRAEEARAAADDGDSRTAAERELAGAVDAERAAGERRDRLDARRAVLEQEAERSHAEARALAAAAAGAATELEAAPRVAPPDPPGDELADVLEWGARAHAAVLVGRSGLDAERERIFREANELASSVLGEPLQSTNVAVVRRRLEELLA